MQTYEQGQVCYLTGKHGEAVKHVYLGSQWVPMSAEMESVIKILNDRYSARDAEWQSRVEKLEAALKGALREHGSCDWNGCWCQDARAALGREA